MSDSDSDTEFLFDYEDATCYLNAGPVCPPADLLEKWHAIPVKLKKDAGERMKVCAFWFPILLQPDEYSDIAHWAVHIGLISFEHKEDPSLKHLHRIEILETILRAMEKGILKRDLTRQLFLISSRLNSHYRMALSEAMDWLKRADEPGIQRCIMDLGSPLICFSALHLVFTEFSKFIREMCLNMDKTMKALMAQPQEYLLEKCEEMKRKGNENFQKQRYEDAVKFYSKAINFYPDNHFIYGNRALCFIRCKQYLKAVADGKCATLIKPHWAKGHYRYCEALFFLGEHEIAVKSNRLAQKLCKDDHEGIKDLEQQQIKFNETLQAKAGQKRKNRRSSSANRPDTAELQQTVKANHRTGLATSKAPQAKVSDVKLDKQAGKNGQTTQMESSTNNSKPSNRDFSLNNGKEESNPSVRKKTKNKHFQSGAEKADDSKAAVCKELRSTVHDAHTALTDLRSRNAEQAFSHALAILEANTPKSLGLSTVDSQLLFYGRASALTEIGQPEELAEAHKILEKIKSFETRTFQCLVYYAIGRVYLKENRFAAALEQFSFSLQMVKNQITPGKLTWPLTKELVKETQPDYLKKILESAIELCKFPPIPDAICRLEKCLAPFKAEIYLTDPDFKGFIRMSCCENCTVEYHITCWKVFKTSSFSEKNEKDFLQERCLTPDCIGKICNIKIYGPTGLIKCKFEVAIVKPQTQKKTKVNQKCTSVKKLKSKEEHRFKRQQHKLSFQDKKNIISDEGLPKKEDSKNQIQQKAWLVYRDRALLQISQNMELLKEEQGFQLSALTTSLKPWLELDSSRGNRLAQRMLNLQEALETVAQAVELLLERKNRVWARVFIQVLSCCQDVNPKLNTWASKLNSAGLTAAKSFIERYAEHLVQLDLKFLHNFGPMKELIMEKLGTRPELLSSIDLTKYLKKGPPHDTRLFIWTMEEHRDEYPSFHSILDEYFDMMDGQCSILKKSDESENNSPIKTKNRGRKKKQKEPKGVIILSGMRAVTPRDDWDQDYFEEDSLSFLHPGDPFSVPSHLRDQVADFEDQYNGPRIRSHYEIITDNNPDPTKETLYDYFAQILEEHGPLLSEDPLLVGELEHFPSRAQLKIHEAGGFESFLLESLRFMKIGRRLGLAKHAMSMQQAEHEGCLDDLDEILDANPEFPEAAYKNYLDNYSAAETAMCLPNPYVYEVDSVTNIYSPWSICDDQQQASYLTNTNYANWNHYISNGEEESWQMDSASLTTGENILTNNAAAPQTCQETMRNVAVNTELYEHFESCPGDLNIKEKHNYELKQQIENMANGCNGVNLKQKEEVTCLEEDIQKITTNIQVTNKELVLFQQKLEEEVKRDQKEKKANQEVLKSLKVQIEKLLEEQGSLARNIRETKAQYEAKLNDFLELGNQSAAEKMSLEDEIKRCKGLSASATRRSYNAQFSFVESRRDQGLYSLRAKLADAKVLLGKIDDAANRLPNQDFEMTKKTWRATVKAVEEEISSAQARYQQEIEKVKNGIRVCDQPEPANIPLSVAEFTPQPSAQMPRKTPSPLQPPASEAPLVSAPLQNRPKRTMEPAHATVFDKAIERLAAIFPDYTRFDLMRFVQELRLSFGGSFGSMTLQDVVGGVTQLILDHQDKLASARSNIVVHRDQAQSANPPLATPANVWQSVGHQRTTHSSALNREDPCIICHEDMSPEDLCVLECRHSFHKECIRSWLKEQSTCPTCRDHALLPEDFPALTVRRRQIQ